jgi:hypothetical protein
VIRDLTRYTTPGPKSFASMYEGVATKS